jgi:ferric-dicitrate binding protein FerR (iron transport regulator)
MSIETRAARYVIDMEEDRTLSPQRRARIQRWLAKDPKHRETFNVIRASWRMTEVLRAPRPVKPS